MTSISLRRFSPRTISLFRQCGCTSNNFNGIQRIVSSKTISTDYFQNSFLTQRNLVIRTFATNRPTPDHKDESEKDNTGDAVEPKLGLVQRFKQMYRDYWYVLVPVHLVTSAGWFGGFYYMAKSGVDIVALLQSVGFSESFTKPLGNSSMGYLAISYALYKIATPIRYTVTLGGTTIAINYLKNLGYIKPVPSKEKLKEMYKEKRESLRGTLEETKEELRHRKSQLKERKDNIMGDYANFKKELKNIKNK